MNKNLPSDENEEHDKLEELTVNARQRNQSQTSVWQRELNM